MRWDNIYTLRITVGWTIKMTPQRLITEYQEQIYRMRHHDFGGIKYHGVNWDRGRWRAFIRHKGKTVHIGMYDTAEEAAMAFDKKAITLGAVSTKLNFSNRAITMKEEQIYRLVSPDFYGLTYKNAAKLMHMTKSGIQQAITRIKKKCPALFPIQNLPIGVLLKYELWMDGYTKTKF